MTGKKKEKSVQLATADFENTSEAVLAKFENGSLANPTALTSINYYSTDNCIKIEPVRRFKRKILVAETSRMKYVGANFGQYSASYHTCCDYYLGVVDKATKKLKLMNCEWYNLKPAIAGSIFKAESNEEKDVSAELTYQEKNAKLTASFGSLRRQKAVEARYRHKVKPDDLQEVIQATVVGVDAPDETKLFPGIEEFIFDCNPCFISGPIISYHTIVFNHIVAIKNVANDAIPPRNIDAKNVEDVYNINDLIAAEECFALESQAAVWAEASKEEIETWIAEKKYAGFILDCLLQLRINEETRLDKCVQLLYLHYLTTLLSLRGGVFKRKDPLWNDMPDLIKKKVLNTYFQSTGQTVMSGSIRSMSAEKKDKLLADIIVLALITNHFKCDYEKLMHGLHMTMKRFQLLITAVGAKIEKSGKGKLAKNVAVTLSLPLAVLETKLKRIRQKRN